MKSKDPTVRRHTSAAKNGNGNGRDGNGRDGHGNGRAKGATVARGRREEDVLDGQPPIAELLVSQRMKVGKQLDKTMLLSALMAFKKGDFRARLPVDLEAVDGKIADAFNDVIEMNQRMAEELDRLSIVVGKEGKISQRASIGAVTGSW